MCTCVHVCMCVHVCVHVRMHFCGVGARESAINRAEGLRQSKILTSEAEKIQQINRAQGEVVQLPQGCGGGGGGG